MQKARQETKPISADEIAEMADRGEDVSRFFTGQCRRMPPIPKDASPKFLNLVQRFRDATVPEEIHRLGDEVGQAIFG
jgi:hypothetical protein